MVFWRTTRTQHFCRNSTGCRSALLADWIRSRERTPLTLQPESRVVAGSVLPVRGLPSVRSHSFQLPEAMGSRGPGPRLYWRDDRSIAPKVEEVASLESDLTSLATPSFVFFNGLDDLARRTVRASDNSRPIPRAGRPGHAKPSSQLASTESALSLLHGAF